jgi:hypothetical protein
LKNLFQTAAIILLPRPKNNHFLKNREIWQKPLVFSAEFGLFFNKFPNFLANGKELCEFFLALTINLWYDLKDVKGSLFKAFPH